MSFAMSYCPCRLRNHNYVRELQELNYSGLKNMNCLRRRRKRGPPFFQINDQGITYVIRHPSMSRDKLEGSALTQNLRSLSNLNTNKDSLD